ncbi:MAG: hypothetical protein IJ642_10010 [Oscillospiraceae bacterium]|nr:hypothetical protein [Oscillospiraceae bacterium]
MNLRKEIKQAYDSVHAPEDTAEKIRQELYQKDIYDHYETHEHDSSHHEPFRQETGFRRYGGFVAAAAVMGLVIGISVQSMLARQSSEVLQPSATVPVEVTEETTETESDLNNSEISGNAIPDRNFLSEQENYHEQEQEK